jgi:hypothetical protein
MKVVERRFKFWWNIQMEIADGILTREEAIEYYGADRVGKKIEG